MHGFPIKATLQCSLPGAVNEDWASGHPELISKISLPIPELLSMDALMKKINIFNNLIKSYKKYVQGSHGFFSMTSGMFTYNYICFKPVSSI